MFFDDVLLASNDEEVVEECKNHCDKEFPGTELIHTVEKPISFLGMSIHFDYVNLIIRYNTTMYIEELCEKYGIDQGMPMPFTQALMKSDPNDKPLVKPTEFKPLVMPLFYVAKKCRLDILFPASPTEKLMAKAYQLLAYLYETKDM